MFLITHTTIGHRDKVWQGKLVANLDTVLREIRDTHPRLQTEPKHDYLIPFLKKISTDKPDEEYLNPVANTVGGN